MVMPLNTRHWSIIGVLGIDVANRALGAICGHSVDVTTIDYASIGYTVIVGLADFIHTHFGNYVPAQNQNLSTLDNIVNTAAQALTSLKSPSPTSLTSNTTQLTPDS